MKQHINQFIDKFKFLTSASKSITDISIKVNSALNKSLPARVLSKANIFNMTIDVAQDLTNVVMLHVEDSLVEQNMLVAQKETSIRGLATLSGHHAVRPISAKGIIAISLQPNVQIEAGPKLILQGATFKCLENNLTYSMLSSTIVQNSNDRNCFVEIIEGTWESARYVAIGQKHEKLKLDAIGAIEQYNIIVHVNGELWSVQDSLYDMKHDSKQFMMKNGIGNQVDLIFGDGVHGLQLSNGDVVTVEMLITSGEAGNCTPNATFKQLSGVYATDGSPIDIANYSTITVQAGFTLGSNGEHIETTRSIAGYNSRSLVFIRPENLKAYLSRLSILSHIDVWTDQDDLVFNMLLLPNISGKLSSYHDYFELDDEDFKLSSLQKESIIEYINTSGSQVTSSEILIKEPVFAKYAMFVYINAPVIDKNQLKLNIENTIAQIMLEHTFIDVDMNHDKWISQSLFIDKILEINSVKQVSIDTVSEVNELARINGFYEITNVEFVGSVKKIQSSVKQVPSTLNPNLGFDELGAIVTRNNEIPLIRGGFMKYNGADEPVLLDKAVYIFHKTVNGYEEL